MEEQQDQINHGLDEAWRKRRLGNYTMARKLVQQAHNSCAEDDFESLGRIFHIYRQLAADQGQQMAALEYARKSVAYYEQAGIEDRIAHANRHLADLEFEMGEYQAAGQKYERSLQLYQSSEQHLKGDVANGIRRYALLLEKLGNKEEAIKQWKEAKKLYQEVGIDEGAEEAEGKIDELS